MLDVLKDEGHLDVMAFMKTYREMENVVERYEREVWEYEQKQKPAERPSERKSVRERLRRRANSRRETENPLTDKGNFD